MTYPYQALSEVPKDLAERICSMPGRPPSTPAGILKRVRALLGDGPYPAPVIPPEEVCARVAAQGLDAIKHAIKNRHFRDHLRVLIWEEDRRAVRVRKTKEPDPAPVPEVAPEVPA